jgi:hypothetical protein
MNVRVLCISYSRTDWVNKVLILRRGLVRMKIQNRVRNTLESAVLQEKSVTSQGWLFAIFAESHLNARSMNIFGVRNLFDRAIDNPRYSLPLSP